MTDRQLLERNALDNVCACWFFDLRDEIGEADDETLRAVAEDSQYLHKQNQKHNPVSDAEFQVELMSCPDGGKS